MDRARCFAAAVIAAVIAVGCGEDSAAPGGAQEAEQEKPSGVMAPPAAPKMERAEASEADVAEAVKGNNAFALDLYAKLRGKEGNLVFSPYSISTALAMTYAGARGGTAKQMEETLHFTLGQEKLRPAMADLVEGLNERGGEGAYEMVVANRLWGQTGYTFLPEFLALSSTYYGAGLEQLDFAGATGAARRTINAWVEEQTRDKIKELLKPPDLTPLTRLVLTNAIYFKGNWMTQFKKSATHDKPFKLTAAESVNVPMMYREHKFPLGRGDGCQVLEMPYVGEDLAMVVILPDETGGLAEIESSLSAKSLGQWLSGLRKSEVQVYLPRFKVEFGVSLKEKLKAMGMPLAFDATRADFSGMTDNPEGLYIGAVIHKAFVDVNEEGTEAAAATAVVMEGKGMPEPSPVFRADHPFLFLIRDRRTGSILFIGRVMDPRG